MTRRKTAAALITGMLALWLVAPATRAAAPRDIAADLCSAIFSGIFELPSTEPLAACQWNMALIKATAADAHPFATGRGVSVGVIDSGVDTDHPDLAANLDLSRSCSFITTGTPTAHPEEIADGDCTNKTAVEDLAGHGTHVASIIAAPVNGVGVAGVAPNATIVALKACTIEAFCFADAVAAALRYAGDQRLDIVNLSLFADPFLFYCTSDAEQRTILQSLQSAARYAQQRGVLIVASAGNEEMDLQHPGVDVISPDWPPGNSFPREVKNSCRVAPAELPGVVAVSAVGPIGVHGYGQWIASYSSVGNVDVTAPGGDYFAATATVQDAVLGAVPPDSLFWSFLDPIEPFLPGLTISDGAATYAFLNGTSMSAPHAAGVAALIKERHPDWGSDALKAALTRSSQRLGCPPSWEPVGPEDQRERCYGNGGHTSFFGSGLVDAAAASRSRD
jgi:subtilisin family serine protease